MKRDKVLDHAAQGLAGKIIVITGASGYIASATVEILKMIPCTLARLSRSGRVRPVEGGVARILDLTCDLGTPGAWLETVSQASAVLHFAAQTSARTAEISPGADLLANALPMLHLLEAARKGGLRPAFIFAGTSTQVGIPERLPVDETHPDHPVTVYDTHKLLCEHYLKHFCREGAVHGTSLRLTNVYGPGQAGGNADRGILNRMVHRAVAGDPLTIYGAGEAIRDHIFITDTAKAFVAAASHAAELGGGHYVIGSGEGHSIAQSYRLLAERAKAATGQEVEVLHIAPPEPPLAIERRNFVANSASFSRITGWHPSVRLAQGLDLTMTSICK